MNTHAHRLQLALLLSLGLGGPVACGDKDLDDTAGSDDGGGEEGGGEEGGGEEGGDDGDLDEVPEADYPVCEGDDTGGFVGPCCVDVYCIDPSEGSDCPTTDEVTAQQITGKSLGSGECECEAPQGPYAPYGGTDKACCYTVGIQSCEGRPLYVDGGIRRASLRRGTAWA